MATEWTGLTPYIEVFDMIASVQFYRNILGFEVVFASPEVVTPEGRFSHFMRLRLGRAELMLNTAYDSGERPAGRAAQRWRGHSDVAFYIDCSDVDAYYDVLRQKGVEINPPVIAPYGMKFIQVRDPDGYRLQFHMPV